MKALILGGVRSGKSRHAESLARDSGLEVIYLATARPGDAEMRARIAAHRARRPAHWRLVEEPLALASALSAHAATTRCLIVDCLTLWLTQLLCEDGQARLAREKTALLDTLPKLPGRILLIGNETNMGVMPMGEFSRRYCDEAGALHQALAAQCDRVTLMVAGLPLLVKGGNT
ncbi:bifunctional adenosylcobinamide kinase/adenosylcobinamide-phosphate guanylyltransferase [Methyloterricola oryzae]|uniref:bifunctional adenosylcobinamide kinase/adenosylcobinamide-phosphate guanylyltransferase n=1 Tax=Methyloterricola oryzae TaxID=1495050 RepID=UPI0005EB8B2A|nr:bifunctional adenosylcobinamide kinase/adenosylcobinamide-phosphate guanylyltransferase [Methyloterricola oryzae]